MQTNSLNNVNEMLHLFEQYMQARKHFLNRLDIPSSCRDPLAEFSEVFVNTLLQGTMAESRTQKGYDLISSEKRKVQVKYLFNFNHKWINEHPIQFTEGVDDYALVIFQDHHLQSVLVFQRETIQEVCQLLQKKHPHQDYTLQFTKKNYDNILKQKRQFSNLGVKIFTYTE